MRDKVSIKEIEKQIKRQNQHIFFRFDRIKQFVQQNRSGKIYKPSLNTFEEEKLNINTINIGIILLRSLIRMDARAQM